MARPHRIQFPGAIYHLTARGNNGALIFHDDVDRELFLALYARTATRLGWKCFVYCLMGNHYHLLVDTPRGDLAVGMMSLNGDYARALNRRRGRKGHLFEQRYHAELVERESHFLEVTRYVVLNPVRAGLCTGAEEWRWSSFRAAIGLTCAPAFLDCEWVTSEFGPDANRAREEYAAFVAKGSPFASLEGVLAA